MTRPDNHAKGLPARRPRARRARSPKPTSMGDTSPSHASSFSIHPEKVSLTQMLEALNPHDHLCLIYESPEEWRAAAVPFIAIGLKRGQKCIYIVDTSTADEIRKYLGEEGVDVASAEKSGQLSVLHETKAYTKEGSFDPNRMIALLISETEKAITEGYTALRVTGEMTWVLRGHPGSEKLLEYEAKLNRDFFPKYPCLAICQYDRWKFDPEIIKGVVMTHPLLIKGNQVYHNLYYIPPQEFLNEKCAELEVQHWLNNLEREQQVQETLCQSEEKYRTLTEQSLMGLVVLQDFRIVFANDAFAEISGYSVEELLSLPPAKVQAMVHPEDQPLVWERFRDRLAGKTVPSQYEYRGIRKDGSVCWLEMHANRIEYGGKPAIQGAIIDTTERKQAARELQEVGLKYKTMLETMQEGYYELDLAGNWTFLNDAFCHNLGYSKEELTGTSYRLMTFKDDVDPVSKIYEEVYRTGKASTVFNVRAICKDGSIRTIEASAFPLINEQGTIIGFRGIGRDITERKWAEEEVRDSEERYRTLFEKTANPILITDTEGNYIECNEAALQFLECTRGELLTKNVRDTIPPGKERIMDEHIPLWEKGGRIETEYFVNGKLKTLDLTITPGRWRGKQVIFGVGTDITERKQAEEALRQSEEKYRTLVESIDEVIFSIDANGCLTYINPTAERLAGYKLDEFIGQHFGRFVPPDDLPDLQAEFERALVSETRLLELTVLDKEGKTLYICVSSRPILKDGQAVGLTGTVTDITKRRQAEQALRESEEKFRLAFENANTGMCLVDLNGRLIKVNKMMCDIFGYTREELEKMTVNDIAHPEDLGTSPEFIRQAIAGEIESSQFEKRYTHKEGRIIYGIVSSSLIRDSKGAPMYFISQVQDITEHKRAEEALRQSEARYRTILEETTEGYYEVDLAGTFIFVNYPASILFGYSKEEIVGTNYRSFFTEQEQKNIFQAFNRVYHTGQPVRSLNFEGLLKDGSKRIGELSVFPSRNEKGEIIGFRGIGRDITERKIVEEERRQLELKAQATSRLASVGEMAAGVAHEINNPLTAVTGYAQLLMDREDIPADIRSDL
ncbi:MAG: PAS domain S-box protein, partial [Chloroflexi bacterium]|nr:PAS domain S-box protein [Chloroflexota bacterium]